MVWASFWATFSQTHLVTLPDGNISLNLGSHPALSMGLDVTQISLTTCPAVTKQTIFILLEKTSHHYLVAFMKWHQASQKNCSNSG
jgi:hypothetical protein